MDEIKNILFYSNPMQANSGYGVSARNILPRLKARGYGVGMQPNWGYEGSPMNVDGIAVYGQGGGLSEYETVQNYLKNDYQALVTLYDVFVFDTLKNLVLQHQIPWIGWNMFDHQQLYPWMRDKLDAMTWIVSVSEFGMGQLKQAGYKNISKIPLGVDTKIFKPIICDTLTKEKCKQDMNFPPDCVLIGIFKMNKGNRPGYPYMLEAVKRFIENNPDLNVGLYLHTAPDRPDGYPLNKLLDIYGLTDITRNAEQYQYFNGYTTMQMAKIYNTMDVVLNCGLSEGFGMPVAESQACGVPVVAGDYSAMAELVKPVAPELLVPAVAGYWEMMPVQYWLPDVNKMAECLEKAISRNPEKDREILTAHMAAYDWEKIADMWKDLLGSIPAYLDASCKSVPQPASELSGMMVPRELA